MSKVICKECKHFIWYKWWWPWAMGSVEVEERKECDHPENHEEVFDCVTGETHIMVDPKESYAILNEKGNCKWFSGGKHEHNLDGKMSEEDRKKLIENQESIVNYKQPWWRFW